VRYSQKKNWTALGTALAAGIVAGGVAYLLYHRPQWRRHVVEIGHHLLNVAEGMITRTGLEGKKD